MRRPALYPTVLSLAFVTQVIVSSGISPFAAVRTLIVATALPLVLTLLGQLVLGDRDRGAFAAGLTVLLIMAGSNPLVALLLLGALGLLVVERFAVAPTRTLIRWPRITTLLSRIVAVLAVAVLIGSVMAGFPGTVWRAITMETALRPDVSAPASPDDSDIYMLLLDGYARHDVLEGQFGLDTGPQLDAWRSRGFSIAEASRSNYVLTSQVLASMLHGAHLSEIPRLSDVLSGSESQPEGKVIREVIDQNPTFEDLRTRGYEIEALGPGFEQVAIREADRFNDSGHLNEFEVAMFRRTVIASVLKVVAPDFASAQQRGRIDATLEAMVAEDTLPADRPVLRFGHLPSPHPPWVFHADGSPRTVADLDAFYADTPDSTGLTIEESNQAYGDAVTDLDRRVMETVDRLAEVIERRGRPAVVIVWSDHGSWLGADGGDLRLRFKNLLAYKGIGTDVDFDPAITTVNLMTSLRSQLFETDYEPRADTTYAYGSGGDFDLVEVPE